MVSRRILEIIPNQSFTRDEVLRLYQDREILPSIKVRGLEFVPEKSESVSVAGVTGASSSGVDFTVRPLIHCQKETMDRLDNLLGYMAHGSNSTNQTYHYTWPKCDHAQPESGHIIGLDDVSHIIHFPKTRVAIVVMIHIGTRRDVVIFVVLQVIINRSTIIGRQDHEVKCHLTTNC